MVDWLVEWVPCIAISVALWWAVAFDARRAEVAHGARLWRLSGRTWAWVVAVTWIGLVPYGAARVLQRRAATRIGSPA